MERHSTKRTTDRQMTKFNGWLPILNEDDREESDE